MSGSTNRPFKRLQAASWLSLFTSSGTLICCALPALMVALGAGAAMSSLVSAIPQLVWLSEHKIGVFGLAAFALSIAGGLQWRARRLPCPTDQRLARACMRTRKTSLMIYWFAVAVFAIGGFFAFIAPWLAA